METIFLVSTEHTIFHELLPRISNQRTDRGRTDINPKSSAESSCICRRKGLIPICQRTSLETVLQNTARKFRSPTRMFEVLP